MKSVEEVIAEYLALDDGHTEEGWLYKDQAFEIIQALSQAGYRIVPLDSSAYVLSETGQKEMSAAGRLVDGFKW